VMRWLRSRPYALTLLALAPLNAILSVIRRTAFVPGSVLHISYMGHVPHEGVRVLRANGIKADYLAVGDSPIWDKADFRITSARLPFMAAWREFRMLWSVVARYEIIHSHFMVTMSRSGWEWPILKRMGRKLLIHYRGCEIRDRQRNMALHPAVNICEECDYRPYICEDRLTRHRRALAEKYGDAFVVTTPDLKDFAPAAAHVKFFRPDSIAPASSGAPHSTIRIVHATNHPGIEGTRHIERAVGSLRAKGFAIELTVLRGVTQHEVLAALATADLSIGKMKMGYYANAQVESLAAGVPAITWVRPEFRTPEIEASGLILTSLDELEATLEDLLRHPEKLAAKRAVARASAERLHDNAAIAGQLADIYRGLALDPATV
jgi:hypothetical protein